MVIFCATTAKQTKADANKENICFRRSDSNKYLSPSQSNDYGAGMHWGVVQITARIGVHGMTRGSPLDDEERHSRDYRCAGEATVQS